MINLRKYNVKSIAQLKIDGKSNRWIAQHLSISRNKVNEIVKVINSHGMTFFDVLSASEEELGTLFSTDRASLRDENYTMPDYESMVPELSKSGVTVSLLWEEYVNQCLSSGKQYYGLTQFRKYFNEYLDSTDFTYVIHHKAGERIEVDWAGTKARWTDADTGEVIYGCLFVSVLSFSGYAFAMACPDMKMESWINAHACMYEYFGGVTQILVPDNLKTGVTSHTADRIILNRTYQEMADHYGTIVMPTRVRKPRDKALVENTVGKLTTQLIARMRNYQFFSIDEYNEQLLMELDRFNKKPFQKKEGSRYTIFTEIEQPLLKPLPSHRFEISEWKEAKVQSNCHIAFGKNYYSAPYRYIGRKVGIRIFSSRIEIYDGGILLCIHKRILNRIGQYSTDISHLPPDSRHYGEWNSTRYLNWAKQIGPNTYQVIFNIFQDAEVEQRYYKSVHSILKLADSCSSERLESACRYALTLLPKPKYKNIKTIIRNNSDLCQTGEDTEVPFTTFLRGGDYFD